MGERRRRERSDSRGGGRRRERDRDRDRARRGDSPRERDRDRRGDRDRGDRDRDRDYDLESRRRRDAHSSVDRDRGTRRRRDTYDSVERDRDRRRDISPDDRRRDRRAEGPSAPPRRGAAAPLPEWRHNRCYSDDFYFLSEARVDGKGSPPQDRGVLDVKIAPAVDLKLLRSSRDDSAKALEAAIDGVDSVFTLCAVMRRFERYLQRRAGGADAVESVLFASALRKCCMYFSADMAKEILAFVDAYYTSRDRGDGAGGGGDATSPVRGGLTASAAGTPLDQVAVKYVEKVIGALPLLRAGADEATVRGLKAVVAGRGHESTTVKEFLAKERLSAA